MQLLCGPTLAERVAAIATAASLSAVQPARALRENRQGYQGDLAEEVARIAALLAELAAQDRWMINRRDVPKDCNVSRDSEAPRTTGPVLRRYIRVRRLREAYFGPGLFEDPAWDMILDLAAAGEEGTEVTISSLCIASAVAPTTALRWITRLVSAGLFQRRPDPSDGRRAIVELTPSGRAAAHAFFAAATDALVPLD